MIRKMLKNCKKFLLLVLGIASCTSVFASTAPTTNTLPAKAAGTVTNTAVLLSFVQTASVGRITPVAGQSNTYQLTLENVSPYLTYYTERPGRNSGLALVQNFIKAWPVGTNSFAATAPNATIFSGVLNSAPNAANRYFVVSLSNPQYNGQTNVMTYNFVPLDSQSMVSNQMDLGNIVVVIN